MMNKENQNEEVVKKKSECKANNTEENFEEMKPEAEAEAENGSENEVAEVHEESAPENQDDEEMNTKYLRLMADFQNYKRRVEKEKNDIYAYANEKLVGDMLDVIDNFERALEHAEGDEGFVKGMENIFKILKGVLEKSGLEEIEALGTDFDPNIHNAVMTEESEEYESGKVSAVLQKGYRFNGKVIRPSMVKVVN